MSKSYTPGLKILEDTKVGGATLTRMLGTSAWYAPGAAVSSLVQSISCDQQKIFPTTYFSSAMVVLWNIEWSPENNLSMLSKIIYSFQ